MASKKPGKGFRRDGHFIRIHDEIMESAAYRDLSPVARALLFELCRLFKGHNNGDIFLSEEDAQIVVGKARNTIRKAFKDLESHGFLILTEQARYTQGRAYAYEITFYANKGHIPCDRWRDWNPDTPLAVRRRQSKAELRKSRAKLPGKPATPPRPNPRPDNVHRLNDLIDKRMAKK